MANLGNVNIGYMGDQEMESGLGSNDLTPEGTLANHNGGTIDTGNYPMTDFRRPSMLQIPYRIAVSVEAGAKKFGELKVLECVNMNVQEGTIYGLLGSSGCGKTTLLSCLVGLRELDSGGILICGKPPGSPGSGVPGRLVGYMPQEIALNGEFTIREVCHFFGSLYGMTKDRIDGRVDHLIDLLDLKRCKTQIKNLSGGQKRRASFLVALLHEPEILILDEPTVGVDPVLRSSIWKHLRELVDKFGTTVIITTHYIEEMRQADTVGIMRNGLVMAEASPQQLMDSHNATMLEDVVLHYCLRTEDPYGETHPPPSVVRRRVSKVGLEDINMTTGNNQLNNGVSFVGIGGAANNGIRRQPPQAPYMDNYATDGIQTHSLHRIRALTIKNCIVMLRSVGFLLFVFICPAFIVTIYCYAIGSPPTDLGLGIVNDENVRCQIGGEMALNCTPKSLSCAFVNGFQATGVFNLHFYDNEEEALKDVDRSEIWGFVHFPANFSKHIFDRTLHHKNSNETIEGAKIKVGLDMSTISTGQVIQKLIFETYRFFSTALLTSCNIDITGRDLPISFDRPIYGGTNSKFRNYLAPGMSIAFICFLSTLTCGLAFIVEKKDGMIHRTKVAGVTTIEIMLSHFFPQLGVIIIQNICAFLIMFVMFDIPQEGSLWLAFVIVIWFGISGIGLGFTASTIFDDEKNAMLFGVAVMLPNFILAGVVFPLETMPPLVGKLALLIPGTQPGESIRSVLLRGWGITNHSVYMGFVSPLLFMIVYTIVTIIMLKVKK